MKWNRCLEIHRGNRRKFYGCGPARHLGTAKLIRTSGFTSCYSSEISRKREREMFFVPKDCNAKITDVIPALESHRATLKSSLSHSSRSVERNDAFSDLHSLFPDRVSLHPEEPTAVTAVSRSACNVMSLMPHNESGSDTALQRGCIIRWRIRGFCSLFWFYDFSSLFLCFVLSIYLFISILLINFFRAELQGSHVYF